MTSLEQFNQFISDFLNQMYQPDWHMVSTDQSLMEALCENLDSVLYHLAFCSSIEKEGRVHYMGSLAFSYQRLMRYYTFGMVTEFVEQAEHLEKTLGQLLRHPNFLVTAQTMLPDLERAMPQIEQGTLGFAAMEQISPALVLVSIGAVLADGGNGSDEEDDQE
jgi:hypothetical protein